MADVAQGDYDVALANTGAGDDLYVSAIQAGDDDALGGGVHVGMSPVGRLKVVLKSRTKHSGGRFAYAEERQLDFRDPAATTDIEDSGKAINVAEGERQDLELTVVPETRAEGAHLLKLTPNGLTYGRP